MKHGSSLIYTSASVPNSLPTLIHSSLNIHSLLKKACLKHNVIDRDKILIPPNWDSWGKIRVLRDGFDVEGVSSGWSVDIQIPHPSPPQTHNNNDLAELDESTNGINSSDPTAPGSPVLDGSILPLYERTIPNPRSHRQPPTNPNPTNPRI